ncbi:MAG TPA: WYL domain-containing protein [Gemmatimonadaceae bacterium]|nr:WYL domain-containing protein [Gemmatimonadaceae bacterium]
MRRKPARAARATATRGGAAPRSDAKVQRWVDLLAVLLTHHYPVTFVNIQRQVPGYRPRGAQRESVMRMFERDKDELRAFGVPIETVADPDDSELTGYKLGAREFYLPFVVLRAAGGSPPRRPVPPEGLRSLTTLEMEPDEVDVIARAGELVRTLGDPVLADEAASALRKLAFDVPVIGQRLMRQPEAAADGLVDMLAPSMNRQESPRKVAAGPSASRVPLIPRDHFADLTGALERRKRVRFTYFAMHSGETRERAAEPYGVFFTAGHWYLAARDVEDGKVKSFRLSRITRLAVNAARPLQPEYEIPPDFHLAEYARARRPWELGDGGAMRVTVEFRGESGAAAAAARLGVPVRGSARRRAFDVRRLDAFARWLLSFGGEARVISPPLVRDELAAQRERTLAVYGGADD